MRFWIWLMLCVGTVALQAEDWRIGTYNIRLRLQSDSDAGNGWERRRDEVRALLRFHQLEIVGVQEALADQLADLVADGTYGSIGVGRDDGRAAGEFAALLYRKDLWEVRESGTFWLSQTPGEVSFGWDAIKYRRICTWGLFLDRRTGAELKVWNVHFDHEAVVARREAAKLLLERTRPDREAGRSCVLLGDFNCTPRDEPYAILAGEWKDARSLSLDPAYGPDGTFNAFQYTGDFRDRIDHIWVGPGLTVLRHGTLTDARGGRFPSDHFPVVVDLRIQKN